MGHRYVLQRHRTALVVSVGEPLMPEAVVCAENTFGQVIYDNRWQTETGGIMIALK